MTIVATAKVRVLIDGDDEKSIKEIEQNFKQEVKKGHFFCGKVNIHVKGKEGADEEEFEKVKIE